MNDNESLQFAEFVLDRFSGAAPEEKLLVHALGDFKVILARNRVNSAHDNNSASIQSGVRDVYNPATGIRKAVA